MLRLTLQITLVLSAVLGIASTATAASYGSFTGATGSVSYLNVQDLNGLFGAPSVSVDSLDFTPLDFEARCSQCPAGVTTTDTLSLDIDTISGRAVDEIRITEGLDFTVLSYDTTGLASARVQADLVVDVLELNGVPVSGIGRSTSIVYVPSLVSVDGFGSRNGIMIGDLRVDIAEIIASAGATGDATLVRIALSNTLQAIHDGSGGEARIRKRDADFISMTIAASLSDVPEPTTAVLLLGGLAGLAARRERRG